MPTTYNDYTGDGSNTFFPINFEYLEDEHVTVEVDGVATTAFTINTAQATDRVEMNVAPGAAANVRVRRQSQRDTDLVDFENGSVLTERELDRAYQHNRYLHEEIGELNDSSLQKAAGTNNWDAGNNKIVNVATPTDTSDASTKDYVDSKVSQVSTGASSPPNKYVFTGTAGANTTYSVTGAEVNGDTAYDVSIDGAVQEPTTDFTVDPDTDTLTIIPTLSGGEDIVVIERGFGVALTTGNIDSGNIANDAIVEDKIADDAVTADKIADDAVTTDKIADDSVSLAKMKANSVDSDQYVDGSIDRVHLAADIVDGTKIADDSIDSEHYVDGSIDSAHINTTDSVFNVQTDGKVGIGTASPVKLLTIVGSNAALRVAQTTAAAGGVDLTSSSTGGVINVRDASGIAVIDLDARPGNDVVFNSGGNFGINTTTPSAPLEVSSTTGGVIIPRMNTTERTAISASNGEMVYDTDLNKFYGYAGGAWVALH
jgi:hypothetical protein